MCVYRLIKEPRNAFNIVENKINILELIHSDICYTNNVLTHGGKGYFTTFIFSRYCYIYLTNSKS